MSGYLGWWLSGNNALPIDLAGIRLAAYKRMPIFNGVLECRLFEHKNVEGR